MNCFFCWLYRPYGSLAAWIILIHLCLSWLIASFFFAWNIFVDSFTASLANYWFLMNSSELNVSYPSNPSLLLINDWSVSKRSSLLLLFLHAIVSDPRSFFCLLFYFLFLSLLHHFWHVRSVVDVQTYSNQNGIIEVHLKSIRVGRILIH